MPHLNPSPADVPKFALYGENGPAVHAEFVHVERIETRSRLHDWHIVPHTHSGLFQVVFLFGGEVDATLRDTRRLADGPVALTVHPSLVHGFTFSENAEGYVLTVDQNVLFSTPECGGHLFAPLFVEPLVLPLPKQSCARIEPLLDNLAHESTWREHGHTLMQAWLTRSILVMLTRVLDDRRADQSGHAGFALFSRFRAAVEERYHSGATVADYAADLNVTPGRLTRLCMKLTGKSAFDMVQDRLMLEACRRLTYASSNVATIAYELGFEDPAYFSRVFKKHMGLTPSAFRSQGER